MQSDYVCVTRNDTIFVRHESSCLRGCTSQVQCAFFRPQSVPRNTPGNSGRSNSDKVGRRGLVPRPVRLSTETKVINKAPSVRNCGSNCISACRRNTKLRRAKTALFGFDREHENPGQACDLGA